METVVVEYYYVDNVLVLKASKYFHNLNTQIYLNLIWLYKQKYKIPRR